MQNFDHNSGFEKNANFCSENWRKSQKIVIITSTPVFRILDVWDSHRSFLASVKRRVHLDELNPVTGGDAVDKQVDPPTTF
jgi:hypothetical protein